MKYVLCNLCGADNWSLHLPSTLDGSAPVVDAFLCTNSGYGKHTQIVRCNQCNHIYANPTWDADELLGAYETVEDEVYVEERDGRELTFQKHLDKIEKLIGKANHRSLLDVGAYIGVFVDVANQAGWQAMGVEPSTWAADVAQKNGSPVIQGTLDSAELHGKQFDLITMWDVIEHVDDPQGEVKKCFDLLKPGGLVVLHTMDIGSITAKLMGKRWPWYMEMHIHYFSKESLERLATQAGFDVIQSPTEGRYLRMGYLATRVKGISNPLGAIAEKGVQLAKLTEYPVPVNFGDLFTVYARKPKEDRDER